MNDNDLSTQILSDITVYMKYARYLSTQERRETWEEMIIRNKSMHIENFPKLSKEIESAYELVSDKKVLPSMRSLQFAGAAIKQTPSATSIVGAFSCSSNLKYL